MKANFLEEDGQCEESTLAEINMVPMIDVMLVLLIVFMITAPLLTHSVKLDLPSASSSATPTKSSHIMLAIDAQGEMFWNNRAVSDEQLGERINCAAQRSPIPDIHLYIDKAVRYEQVSQLLARLSSHQLTRIAFVSEPEE